MYNAESVWKPSIHVDRLWDSKQCRKWKVALPFLSFAVLGSMRNQSLSRVAWQGQNK